MWREGGAGESSGAHENTGASPQAPTMAGDGLSHTPTSTPRSLFIILGVKSDLGAVVLSRVRGAHGLGCSGVGGWGRGVSVWVGGGYQKTRVRQGRQDGR